ncbi:hypothetical protein NCCP2331_34720 [Sporosarcina sp. NCCP-2331]|nr:hypothetical protein NCCP2331_34720 [Sporosarcina sp. NCCP-2331]GLB57683.1 hypothetical protein NCCP2378_34730 [Sporosarcina sp. NCCP-2378]
MSILIETITIVPMFHALLIILQIPKFLWSMRLQSRETKLHQLNSLSAKKQHDILSATTA